VSLRVARPMLPSVLCAGLEDRAQVVNPVIQPPQVALGPVLAQAVLAGLRGSARNASNAVRDVHSTRIITCRGGVSPPVWSASGESVPRAMTFDPT
jgi:hypothetical protein